MGQISMTISAVAGSVLSDNQHQRRQMRASVFQGARVDRDIRSRRDHFVRERIIAIGCRRPPLRLTQLAQGFPEPPIPAQFPRALGALHVAKVFSKRRARSCRSCMGGEVIGECREQGIDRRKESRLKGRPVGLHPTIEIPQAGYSRVRQLRVVPVVAKPPQQIDRGQDPAAETVFLARIREEA